ncbi:MAG TPA: aminotransferase class III-fold pyridoxal phosphate-dependent enzyme, partial [Thermoplasmata archaeon]|nr:aminotransferase class III-fold pyridoxal phosphate-dependent enzyme [Thermoplasmata archaeon]
HCTTLGGTPVACEASLATIRVIEKEKLMENATRIGDHVMKRMREVMETSDIVGDVRGKGLMIGVEIVKDKKSKARFGEGSHDIIHKAWKKGIVAIGAGENCFRIAPPLVITKDQADFGVDVLTECIKEVEKER